jgi:hypothetical protein
VSQIRFHARQAAAALLKMAKTTSDPGIAARLVEAAAGLKDQAGELPPPVTSPAKPPALPERIEAVLRLREKSIEVIGSPWETARAFKEITMSQDHIHLNHARADVERKIWNFLGHKIRARGYFVTTVGQ